MYASVMWQHHCFFTIYRSRFVADRHFRVGSLRLGRE